MSPVRRLPWRTGPACRLGLALLCGGLARGQFTESAAPVEPGKWLWEADLFNAGRDRAGGAEYRYEAFGYLQWTRGVRESFDLQFGMQAYQRETYAEPGLPVRRDERWGDLCLRSKWLLPASSRPWEVALLPFVSVPLDDDAEGHRHVHLGLILPVSRPLGRSGWFDAQVQLDGSKWGGERRDWSLLASANVQRDLGAGWGGYLEVVGDFADGWRRAAVSGGFGLTRTLGRGGIDAALYGGVTGEAVDWELALRLYWEI